MMNEVNAQMPPEELEPILDYFKQVHNQLLDFVDALSLSEREIPNVDVVWALLQILKNDS